ncbi:MAG TPA: DNA mismatch repair protein MutS, partial [Candidatus Binataceae bacterium]|nr:DNA mismatch repair protein MutS [Candidatus Binataceae bacterium]
MPVKQTPLIAQYLGVKQRVPDAILFFRLGDFYEMFFEDAEVGARVLDIQLTSRSKDGVPLCGVPYHAAEPYVAKLLRAGHKVAICEQAAGDGNQRGLMPRQIVRVITPGTVGEETVLTAGEKSFLLAIANPGEGFAIAALDVSTGEFIATGVTGVATLREEVTRIGPREILIPRDHARLDAALARLDYPITRLAESNFGTPAAEAIALRFGIGAAALDEWVGRAAGAALAYVEENFGRDLNHLHAPVLYRATEYMTVDEVSRRHLELVASSDGGRTGSLLAVIDETITPVGARTLANWVVYPLLDLAAIRERHDAVEEFFDADLGGALSGAMARIGDLERLAGRIGTLRASPRDCANLGRALAAVGALEQALWGFRAGLIRAHVARLQPRSELVEKIASTLGDEPPVNPRDGNLIRTGFHPEVDELRGLAVDARGVMARLEAEERERTRIPSLKVRYNQVFGYYLEVTKSNLDRVPADYERKQTLVGAERFTTARLRELERKILSAESGVKELEHQLFIKLLRDLAAFTGEILETARAVGELDALMSLARVARRRGYVRPEMNQGVRLWIRDGRHPVLEAGLGAGEFVPNDLDADSDDRQLLLITGPNMAGKST